MPGDLRDRVTDQFAYRSDRADIWRAFDLVLDTDAFLNLGYSAWYQPHAIGSSQRRLVTEVGRRLAAAAPAGGSLLDVGCGRGGPAIHLASRFEFDATGIDLVPYNVARATENAGNCGVDASFVVGDATALPFATGSFAACTAIDALVYMPDRPAVFAEIGTVLEPGGVAVVTDLVRDPGADDDVVDAFADAWDMPRLDTVVSYERAVEETPLRLEALEDVSAHSVGRFRRWTTPFLRLVDGPLGFLVERALARYDLDPTVVIEQVRRAHRALPDLRHVLLVARQPY